MKDRVQVVLMVSLARVIRSQLSVLVFLRAIFQTFTVTNRLRITLLTLTERQDVLRTTRYLLLLTMGRISRQLILSISRLMFQGSRIITKVCVTIILRRTYVTTLLKMNTSTQRRARPINGHTIRSFRGRLARVITRPIIRSNTRRITPLFQDGKDVHGQGLPIINGAHRNTAIFVLNRSLRSENGLRMLTAIIPRRVVRLRQVLDIVNIGRHRDVPFRPVFLRRTSTLRRLFPKELSNEDCTVIIIVLLESISKGTCRPVILYGRLTPLINRRNTINLSSVICLFTINVLLLGHRHLFMRISKARRQLTSVPNGRCLKRNLYLSMLPNRLLRRLINRRVSKDILMGVILFRVVAMFTDRITVNTYKLRRRVRKLNG